MWWRYRTEGDDGDPPVNVLPMRIGTDDDQRRQVRPTRFGNPTRKPLVV